MGDERVQNQVDEFFSDEPKPELSGDWEVEDEFNEDPFMPPEPVGEDADPVVAPPVEDGHLDQPNGEQGQVVEDQVPVAPPVVAPSIPSSEVETLKEQNKLLMAKLEELLSKSSDLPAPVVPAPQAPAPTPVPAQGAIIDFVGDEDLDEILSSKDKFNALMSKAVQAAITNSGETFLRALPNIVQTQVATQTTLRSQVDAFYNENTDLQPVKKVVANVANEVAAQNPDWDLGKIFEETATKVREMLGLKKTVGQESSMQPSVRPALPGTQKGGNRSAGAPLTALQKQIIDIL